MAFNAHSDYTAMSEINVTPLVDVMLVLLVIFMVTAPLLVQSMHVNLPKTAPVKKLQVPEALELSIDAKGQLFVDKAEVAGPDLEAKLKDLVTREPEVTVRLRADETVPYGRIAEVMASIHRAGIAKLAFVTTAKPIQARR